MLVSIEKELQKKVIDQKEKLKLDPITEVENILNLDHKKDVQILTKISPHSLHTQHQNKLKELGVLESFEEKYGGSVYTSDQIKDIAVKYKLRFINSCFYAGDFCNQVAPKLRSFCKLYKIKEKNLEHKVYILAPSEILHLVGDIKHNMNVDPLLFYKIDENHYRLIHKWGNDFTIFRKVIGFKWENFWQYWFVNSLLLLPVISLFFYLLNYGTINLIICSLGLSFVSSHLLWNRNKIKNFKIVRSHFTPHNWNSCCNFRDA